MKTILNQQSLCLWTSHRHLRGPMRLSPGESITAAINARVEYSVPSSDPVPSLVERHGVYDANAPVRGVTGGWNGRVRIFTANLDLGFLAYTHDDEICRWVIVEACPMIAARVRLQLDFLQPCRAEEMASIPRFFYRWRIKRVYESDVSGSQIAEKPFVEVAPVDGTRPALSQSASTVMTECSLIGEAVAEKP